MDGDNPRLHMVRMESRELVSHAWDARGRFIFHGLSHQREKYMAIPVQARALVCERNVDRIYVTAGLHCTLGRA